MRYALQKICAAFFSLWIALWLNGNPAVAQDVGAGQITVMHPWAPPTLGKQRAGVAYFSLRNAGAQADRLLGIDVPGGGHAQMHSSEMRDGIMRMRPTDAPSIPAGGELVLQPGGMHVMLTDLPAPLIKGESLRLILRFERMGPVLVEAAIEPRRVTQSHPAH